MNAPPTSCSNVQLLNITISCASDAHNRYGIIVITSKMPETMNIFIDVITDINYYSSGEVDGLLNAVFECDNNNTIIYNSSACQ